MKDTKNILYSKTFWALVAIVLAQVLPMFGVKLDDVSQTSTAQTFATVAGAIGAMAGRLTASKNLKIRN